MKNKWYNIKNMADSHAEILIYGVIGDWWESLDASTFAKDLQNLDVENITLRINSPGGSIFDGFAMYNALKDHKATITVKIEALAASAASVVALAGDRIEMANNALFMIHNPWVCTCGGSDELRKDADLLDKIRDNIVNTYSENSNLDIETIVAKMDAETWLNADEAIEAGFVHSKMSEEPVVENSHDLSKFKNAPKPAAKPVAEVKEEIQEPIKAEPEEEKPSLHKLALIRAELDMMEV